MNDIFNTEGLTDKDMVSYAHTIRDKVSENAMVMQQITSNTMEQALLGDFSGSVEDSIITSGDAHQNQMMQPLADPQKMQLFKRVVFDLLVGRGAVPAG